MVVKVCVFSGTQRPSSAAGEYISARAQLAQSADRPPAAAHVREVLTDI